MTDNEFFTVTTKKDGRTLYFKSRHRVPDDINEEDFPHLINISWPYKPTDKEGLPDNETGASHVLFEQTLAHLDGDTSHMMLEVTGNKKKEWFWYVNDTAAWLESMNKALSEQPSFPLKIANLYQPDWMLYHTFVKGVKSSNDQQAV